MFEVDGAITTHQLGLALRAMGQNPSEGEIQTLASSAELSGTNLTDPVSRIVEAACSGQVGTTASYGILRRHSINLTTSLNNNSFCAVHSHIFQTGI